MRLGWGRWGARFNLFLLQAFFLTAISVWGDVASAQTAGDNWVRLAARKIDVRAGRVVFDLRQAKGAYKSVRVVLLSGSLTLTGIEVKYADGAVYREPRALPMRRAERTLPVNSRGVDRFVDRISLAVKVNEEAIPTAVILIEGLQGPAGAAMARSGDGLSMPTTALRSSAEARRRAEEAERAQAEASRQAAEDIRRKEIEAARAKAKLESARPSDEAKRPDPVGGAPAPTASRPRPKQVEPQPEMAQEPPPEARPSAASPPPPPPAGGAAPPEVASVAEEWDVVPVYFGTDRASDPEAERVRFTSERAKRLEIGRALVTVPKRHEVPMVERPWVYRLPFTSIVIAREREDPKRHFTLKEVLTLSREAFVNDVRKRLADSSNYKDHALVFVHGFNTSFDAALYRMAQISYDLKFDGASFVYSWPSKGQLGLSDYSYDRESTGQAEPHLLAFLDLVTRETGATTISVIAHSMGNQLLLPVLRDLRRSTPQHVAVGQVILASPDVDRDTFEYLAGEISGVSRGVTMLAAASDRALSVSRRFWGGVPRAGDVPAGGPIVVAGIDTIDVTAISTDVFSLNHSGYAENVVILDDIRALISTGLRPPEMRLPLLRRVTTAKGDYWRFQAQP